MARAPESGAVTDRLQALRGNPDIELFPAAEPGDGSTRWRVLVEHADPAVRMTAERALAGEGYDVAGCGGPTVFRDARCPLVSSGRCPLVDDADVIVHALNLSYRLNGQVFDALKRRRPEIPVVVDVADPLLNRHADLVAGCHVMPYPMTRRVLTSAVATALHDPGPLGIDGART